MHDDDRHRSRQCDRVDGDSAAVEQQRVFRLPEHRRHLVHDAARHSGGDVLGFLRGARELAPSSACPATREGGERERNLERRARRESRSDRHGRGDRGVETGRRAAAAREGGEHRVDHRSNCRRVGQVDRIDDDAPVDTRPERDDHVPIDRDGQAQPVLVVGVIADEVDTSGRAHEGGVVPEPVPQRVDPRVNQGG